MEMDRYISNIAQRLERAIGDALAEFVPGHRARWRQRIERGIWQSTVPPVLDQPSDPTSRCHAAAE
jgi:hypothetical protein